MARHAGAMPDMIHNHALGPVAARMDARLWMAFTLIGVLLAALAVFLLVPVRAAAGD